MASAYFDGRLAREDLYLDGKPNEQLWHAFFRLPPDLTNGSQTETALEALDAMADGIYTNGNPDIVSLQKILKWGVPADHQRAWDRRIHQKSRGYIRFGSGWLWL